MYRRKLKKNSLGTGSYHNFFFLKKAPKNISLVAPLSLISSHATTKTNAFQKRRCQASLIGNKTNATFTKAVSCTVSRAAITNFNWSVIHHLSQKKHEIWNSKDSITNVKRSQTCKCSNRDCQNSYHELHVKPYRDMASIANFKKDVSYGKFQKKKQWISVEVEHAVEAIANFKKDVAKDISLVAPLSRLENFL